MNISPAIVLLLAAASAPAVQTNFLVRVPRTYDARVQFHKVSVLQREELKEESHVYVHPQGQGFRAVDDPFAVTAPGRPMPRVAAKNKEKNSEQEKKDRDLQKAKPGMESWDGLARDVMDRAVERDTRRASARRGDEDETQDDRDPAVSDADREEEADIAEQDEEIHRASEARAARNLQPADSLVTRDAPDLQALSASTFEPLMSMGQLSPVLMDAASAGNAAGMAAERAALASGGASPAGLAPAPLPDLRGFAPAVPAAGWSIGDAGGGSLFGGGSSFGQPSPMMPDPLRSVFQQDGASALQPAARPASRPGLDEGRKASTLPW